MKWYTDRLKALEHEEPIISVCGDDCAVCPRFLARTEEELHETALFWYRAGWRDRVVGNGEIRCTGCGCRPTCSFMLLPCTRDHGVSACRDCPEFERLCHCPNLLLTIKPYLLFSFQKIDLIS